MINKKIRNHFNTRRTVITADKPSTFKLRCKVMRDYAEQSFKESVQYYIEAGFFWLIMGLLMLMSLGMVPSAG